MWTASRELLPALASASHPQHEDWRCISIILARIIKQARPAASIYEPPHNRPPVPGKQNGRGAGMALRRWRKGNLYEDDDGFVCGRARGYQRRASAANAMRL